MTRVEGTKREKIGKKLPTTTKRVIRSRNACNPTLLASNWPLQLHSKLLNVSNTHLPESKHSNTNSMFTRQRQPTCTKKILTRHRRRESRHGQGQTRNLTSAVHSEDEGMDEARSWWRQRLRWLNVHRVDRARSWCWWRQRLRWLNVHRFDRARSWCWWRQRLRWLNVHRVDRARSSFWWSRWRRWLHGNRVDGWWKWQRWHNLSILNVVFSRMVSESICSESKAKLIPRKSIVYFISIEEPQPGFKNLKN